MRFYYNITENHAAVQNPERWFRKYIIGALICMSISVEEKSYKNFGKCLFADNGLITVGIMVDKGPRIIYFSLKGRENVLFEDVNREFTESIPNYGDWRAYGGHRLWCAPEKSPETYYPDNGKTDYAIDGNKITVKAPATPFGKIFEICVVMCADKPKISINHKIHNISEEPSTFAPWSVTSLTHGGVCIVPLCTRKKGYLPNRVMSLWDYSDIADPRFSMTDSEARLYQDSGAEKAFKAGFNVDDGFAAYAVNGQIFAKCFPAYREVKYPDYCCNFEVYTNRLFLECELLGEEKSYGCGETAELLEEWCIFDCDIDFNDNARTVKSEILKSINTL